MSKRSISLSEYFDQFIDAQIESGRFSSASEVVRAGLRLLEEQVNSNKIEYDNFTPKDVVERPKKDTNPKDFSENFNSPIEEGSGEEIVIDNLEDLFGLMDNLKKQGKEN